MHSSVMHINRHTIAAAILLLVAAGVALTAGYRSGRQTSTVAAQGSLAGELPQTVSGDPESVAALTGTEPLHTTPPLLAPDYPGNYVRQPVGLRVQSDQPVALLTEGPAWVAVTEVSTSSRATIDPIGPQPAGLEPWWEPDGDESPVAFRVLSGVRYSGGGHTIVLSIAEPSPGALAEGPFLGYDRIQLPDGTVAWRNEDSSQPTPNIVSMMKEGYVVSVASDLPHTDLESLADQVVLKPANLLMLGPVSPR